MLLKSILNRVQLHRGFVYGAVRWRESRDRRVLEIKIRARKGTRPTCSGCGRRAAGYAFFPSAASSSFPCGASLYSSSMPCAGLLARAAA